MKVLIIDNYDSFTFNLYQYVGEILQTKNEAFEVIVKRNNEISIEDIKELAPERIIISPGPGTPDDPAYFGVCKETILELGKSIPLLGVCLGMQGIASCFGGKVIHAPLPMHGKTSPVIHNGKGIFKDLPQGIEIMRYHSLMADPESIPECLEITSVTCEDEEKDLESAIKAKNSIMGIRHKEYPIQGIQYHPESFATEGGKVMLENFLINS